ncbi:MAG: hypothetical protein AMXMBFR7_17780 [Planctomycetota bacterium]
MNHAPVTLGESERLWNKDAMVMRTRVRWTMGMVLALAGAGTLCAQDDPTVQPTDAAAREAWKERVLSKFDKDGDGQLNESERAHARRALADRKEDVRDKREQVADRREDVRDHRENVADRREDVRDAANDSVKRAKLAELQTAHDAAVAAGDAEKAAQLNRQIAALKGNMVRDRAEDAVDRKEDVRDRRENVNDRTENRRDRREDAVDRNTGPSRK